VFDWSTVVLSGGCPVSGTCIVMTDCMLQTCIVIADVRQSGAGGDDRTRIRCAVGDGYQGSAASVNWTDKWLDLVDTLAAWHRRVHRHSDHRSWRNGGSGVTHFVAIFWRDCPAHIGESKGHCTYREKCQRAFAYHTRQFSAWARALLKDDAQPVAWKCTPLPLQASVSDPLV
jgi:hypothetical protein